MGEERYYRVSGLICIDIEDVYTYLGLSDAEAEDYEPTELDWKACAYDMFENDEAVWIESRLDEI